MCMTKISTGGQMTMASDRSPWPKVTLALDEVALSASSWKRPPDLRRYGRGSGFSKLDPRSCSLSRLCYNALRSWISSSNPGIGSSRNVLLPVHRHMYFTLSRMIYRVCVHSPRSAAHRVPSFWNNQARSNQGRIAQSDIGNVVGRR
jgi:hypothetical protein